MNTKILGFLLFFAVVTGISALATETATTTPTQQKQDFLNQCTFSSKTKQLFDGDTEITVTCSFDDEEVGKIVYNWYSKTNSAYVDEIKINEDYQSKGLGSYLLQVVIKKLLDNKCTNIELDAISSDYFRCQKQLIKFYKHRNFKMVYDEDGNPGTLMRYKMAARQPQFEEKKSASYCQMDTSC